MNSYNCDSYDYSQPQIQVSVLNPQAPVFDPDRQAHINFVEYNNFPNDCAVEESHNPLMNGDLDPTVPIIKNEMKLDIQDQPLPENDMTGANEGGSSPNNETSTENMPILDNESVDELPKEKIIELILQQVQTFFSREHWSNDSYLSAVKDHDQYVEVNVLANCSQFQEITKNLTYIMEAFKRSPAVEFDETNMKVRPNIKTCIVMLREIPQNTPIDELNTIFESDKCPKPIQVEFIINNSWYITFEDEVNARKAFAYLSSPKQVFKGKEIKARLKSKNSVPTAPQAVQNVRPSSSLLQNSNVPLNQNIAGAPRMYYQPNNTYPGYYQPPSQATSAYFIPSPNLMAWNSVVDMNQFFQCNGLRPSSTYKPQPTFAFNNGGPVRNPVPTNNKKNKINTKENKTDSRNNINTGRQTTNRASTNVPVATTMYSTATSTISQQVDNYHQPDFQSNIYQNFSPTTSNIEVDGERLDAGNSIASEYYGGMPSMMPIYAQSMPSISTQYNSVLPGVGRNNGYPVIRNNANGNRRRIRREEDSASNYKGNGYRGGYTNIQDQRTSHDRRKPQFTLQSNSFPPLPGSADEAEVIEEKPQESNMENPWNAPFSDIMKAKPKLKTEKSVEEPEVVALSASNLDIVPSHVSEKKEEVKVEAKPRNNKNLKTEEKEKKLNINKRDKDFNKNKKVYSNKENRPQPRSNNDEEKSVCENFSKKTEKNDLMQVKGMKKEIEKIESEFSKGKTLTNGDVSPPPLNKGEKEESSKEVKDDRQVDTSAGGKTEMNCVSWANVAKAKDGKTQMEKLSASIKEKDEQERQKKFRLQNNKNKIVDKAPLKEKELKPIRKDLKERNLEMKGADRTDRNNQSGGRGGNYRQRSPPNK